MKIRLSLLLTMVASFMLFAEEKGTPVGAPATAAATAQTIITSDSLDLNLGKKQGAKQGLFRGNVKVDEPRFTMDAAEMTVFFADNDAVEGLEARGEHVIINRKDGTSNTDSEKAHYNMSEKKLTLYKVNRQPKMDSGGKIVYADKIILYVEDNKMLTEGKSRVEMKQP